MGKRIVKIEGMLLIKMYEEHESRFDFNDSVIKRIEKMLFGAEYLYATPEGGPGHGITGLLMTFQRSDWSDGPGQGKFTHLMMTINELP